MILIGPTPEQAPGVTINPGNVEREVRLRKGTLHLGQGVFRERMKGLVQYAHVLFPMLLKPGALIVKGEIPEKVRGLAGEAVKHGSDIRFVN